MRFKIAAANWKMNLTFSEVRKWVGDFKNKIDNENFDFHCKVIIAGSYPYLSYLVEAFSDYPQVCIAAQNCHQSESGAYTGEVSALMLKEIGVEYVIIGHSERREQFHESRTLLREKVDAAIKEGLKVIFCCGENLETREKDDCQPFIEYQIEDSLFHLSEDKIVQNIIAYEPIWAIGTGKTASPFEAQSTHAYIRKLISSRYNASVASTMPIIYGGSCNATNAESLFEQADIDGGLIGGASLNVNDFFSIIRSLYNSK